MDGPPKGRFSISQELIEMIIDQLGGDSNALKRCSLVSRNWAPRCRYRLLRSVVISDMSPAHSIECWSNTFGAFNAALAGLTRELHLRQEKSVWMHPGYLALYQTHLSRFTNVTTLVFVNLVTSTFHAVALADCFGSFARGVRHLRLHRPVTRPSSLMRCVLLFSAAVNIEIFNPRWSVINEREDPPPQLPENAEFTGALYLRGFVGPWFKFFELFSAQSLKFRRILLVDCDFLTSGPAQTLFVATSHVRALHLVPTGNRRPDWSLTLKGFLALETLAFRIPEVGINDADLAGLLDSISSLQFSTLAIDVSARETRCTEGEDVHQQAFLGEMNALDRPLSRLATRTWWRTGRRVTLLLVANNPTAIVGSLTEFQQVGNTWKGEIVIGTGGSGNYWTFIAAKDCKLKGQIPDDSVLTSIGI